MNEDELLAALRQAAEAIDPAPAETLLAARSALAHRDIDAQLATLLEDSAEAEGRELAGVRGQATVRMLTFEAEVLAVEVEVEPVGRTLTCTGQLVPGQTGRIIVRHAGGDTTVAADAIGRFRCEGVQPGPVSFRITIGEGAGSRSVDTSWLTL